MRRPAQSVERAVFTDSTLILPMASLKTKKEQHTYQVPANYRGKNHHTCIKVLITAEITSKSSQQTSHPQCLKKTRICINFISSKLQVSH